MPPERLEIWLDSLIISPKFLSELKEWLGSVTHPRLIIIDTMGRVMPPKRAGASDYEAATQILGQLQNFALDNNLSILFIHHAKKGTSEGNDVFDLSLGSTGINGVMDTILVMERIRKENTATLDITGRDIEERQLTLEFNQESGIWTLGENDILASVPSEQLAVLTALAAGHTTPKDMATATHKNSHNVGNMLDKLRDKGLAKNVRTGEYTLTPLAQEAFAKRDLGGSIPAVTTTAPKDESMLDPEYDPEEPLGDFEVTDEDYWDVNEPVPF